MSAAAHTPSSPLVRYLRNMGRAHAAVDEIALWVRLRLAADLDAANVGAEDVAASARLAEVLEDLVEALRRHGKGR